jgi:hypothetical protein
MIRNPSHSTAAAAFNPLNYVYEEADMSANKETSYCHLSSPNASKTPLSGSDYSHLQRDVTAPNAYDDIVDLLQYECISEQQDAVYSDLNSDKPAKVPSSASAPGHLQTGRAALRVYDDIVDLPRNAHFYEQLDSNAMANSDANFGYLSSGESSKVPPSGTAGSHFQHGHTALNTYEVAVSSPYEFIDEQKTTASQYGHLHDFVPSVGIPQQYSHLNHVDCPAEAPNQYIRLNHTSPTATTTQQSDQLNFVVATALPSVADPHPSQEAVTEEPQANRYYLVDTFQSQHNSLFQQTTEPHINSAKTSPSADRSTAYGTSEPETII